MVSILVLIGILEVIKRMIIALFFLEHRLDFLRQFDRTFAAFREAIEEGVFIMMLFAPLLNIGDFFRYRLGEVVDRDDDRQTIFLDVLKVSLKVGMPLAKASTFSLARSSKGSPPCIFKARIVATITSEGDSGNPAFDIKELLGA
jgi:hypothetical protein